MQITLSSGILPAGQHAEMESTQNFQHFGTKKPDETGGCNENAFLEAFLDLGNGLYGMYIKMWAFMFLNIMNKAPFFHRRV